MSFWIIDRMLPGLVSGGMLTAAMAVLHVLNRRDRRKVAAAQTEQIRALHAQARPPG